MKRLWIIVLALFILRVSAQSDDCPDLINDALTMSADHCQQIGRDMLCYGHQAIDGDFEPESDGYFVEPGDTLALADVRELRLSAMQMPDTWGIALMQVRANLPETLPGQNVTFVLFGDTLIRDESSIRNGMTGTINRGVNVRGGPGTDYAVLGGLSRSEPITVFGRNRDGDWLRMAMPDNATGWIHVDFVDLEEPVTDLAIVDTDAPYYGSMQAFYLTTGIGATQCGEAPQDGMLIQTPEGDAQINLFVNGVDVTLGSTAYLQSQPEAVMKIFVLEGQANVTANDMTAIVPAGAVAEVEMNADNLPASIPRVSLYPEANILPLPVDLLPERVPIPPQSANGAPIIVGHEACNIVANGEPQVCPLYFVNPGSEPIVRLRATFLYAPVGNWSDSLKEPPEIVLGDNRAGAVNFGGYCTLGNNNFIGPIIYNVTLTDEAGNVSQPFEASFNCVSG